MHQNASVSIFRSFVLISRVLVTLNTRNCMQQVPEFFWFHEESCLITQWEWRLNVFFKNSKFHTIFPKIHFWVMTSNSKVVISVNRCEKRKINFHWILSRNFLKYFSLQNKKIEIENFSSLELHTTGQSSQDSQAPFPFTFLIIINWNFPKFLSRNVR